MAHFYLRRIMIVVQAILIVWHCCKASENSKETSVPRSIKKVVSKYGDAVDNVATQHMIRMAVTPFVSTRKAENDKNDFGLYISEIITGIIVDKTKNVKIVERTRLDALTKENALTLSGLISENDAKKVGELLPIDYILTGTYTVLNSDLMINARLVNVITGEIAFSKSDQIEIPDEIKGLFPVESSHVGQQSTVSGSQSQSRGDICESRWNSVYDKASSAPPSEFTSALVKEGMKIPFDLECGKLHIRIIDRFVKSVSNNKEYTSFLIQSTDTMKFTFGDHRGVSVMHYFAADSVITPDEWNASCRILSRIDYSPYGNSIRSIIRYEDTVSTVQKDRFTQLFKQCADHKIGIRPIQGERLLDDVLNIMGASYRKDNFSNDNNHTRKPITQFAVLLTILNIADPYLGDTASQAGIPYLTRAWKQCSDRELKERMYDELCKKIKSIRVNTKKDPDLLIAIVDELTKEAFGDDNAVKLKRNDKFIQMEKLAECGKDVLVTSMKGKSVKDGNYSKLLPFCLNTGIDIEGVPTLDTLKYWLAGEEYQNKIAACKYLMYMGKRAAPLESNIIRAIRKGMNAQPNRYFNENLIDALGQIQSKNPEVQKLLVECLTINEPGYITDAPIERAIALCGPSIVPLVKSYFLSNKDQNFYETLTIIDLMGNDAKDLFGVMQSYGQTCGNAKYKAEIEQTFDDIRSRK